MELSDCGLSILLIIKRIMLKNKIFEYISKTASWFNKNRKIKTDNDFVKVNFGSSLAVHKGWINIDIDFNLLIARLPESLLKIYYRNSGAKNWWSEEEYIRKLKDNTFYHHRLEFGLPFHDNSVDVVYTSHTLEHLFKADAEMLVRESFRILRPGGLVRICLPDLQYAFELYTKGEKEKALKYFFADSKSDYTSRHMYMYDYEMMKDILEKNKFVEINRCDYQQGKAPDLEHLDVRPDETFYIEALKPYN